MKNKFVAYWGGYLFSPTQTLNNCPHYIDTVILAFIGPNENSDVETKFISKIFKREQIINWILELKSRGKKILLSILDTPHKHWDTVDFKIFGKSLKKVMIDWHVDGFDIDSESGEKSVNYVSSFVKLINCVRNVIGKKKTLSYTCYEGKGGYDNLIFDKVKNKLDYIQLMAYYYNFDEMKQ